ncbi:MAG: cyclic pyranopterin monophosphate synthase MoaC [Lachnospiraceae bacterium]|nr:cyclic pyranopterin monophosphate synthase MoaC [Lachnospiraceae bacterium]
MNFIRSLDENSADRVNGLSVFDINNPRSVADYIINTSFINAEQDRDTEKEPDFTHFDSEGNARMVDVSDKDVTHRKARARARVLVNRSTFELIKSGGIKKGDVLTVAQIAGIMGAKRTPDLIPMCHPIITDGTELRLSLNEESLSVDIESSVSCTGRTGVEMEAICACTVAAMTVYDMCKAVQRDIVLTDIRLLSKSGGIHGDYEL